MHGYIASIVAVVAFVVLTACSGKGSDAQGNVPDKMVRTHGDSLALAARFTGDFQHFLAVTDSQARCHALAPIRKHVLRFFFAILKKISTFVGRILE